MGKMKTMTMKTRRETRAVLTRRRHTGSESQVGSVHIHRCYLLLTTPFLTSDVRVVQTRLERYEPLNCVVTAPHHKEPHGPCVTGGAAEGQKQIFW